MRLRIGATGFRCRARSAAGRTFNNRTLKAGWPARAQHSSVVDAAGAIYVLGGSGSTTFASSAATATYFQDVWVSTDGGARPDSVGGGRGVHWVGTMGVLRRY